jgi:hypothetical protein
MDSISQAVSAFAGDQIWVGISWGFQFSEPADMSLQRSPNVANKRCYYLTTSEFGTFPTSWGQSGNVRFGGGADVAGRRSERRDGCNCKSRVFFDRQARGAATGGYLGGGDIDEEGTLARLRLSEKPALNPQ